MTENPLQHALNEAKRAEACGGRPILNLVESSFHSAGFFLDKELLVSSFSAWADQRDYRPEAEGRRECREAIAGYYRKALGQARPEVLVARSAEPAESRGTSTASSGTGLAAPSTGWSSIAPGPSPDEVFCTASSSESYGHLFGEFCSPGDNILLPLPSYPLFEDLASHAGLETRFYPLDEKRGWAPDLDVLHALMDEKTRFVVLISPNNPCGSVLSRQDLEAILRLCLEESVMVISDEVFSEFLYPPLQHLPRAWELSKGVPVFTLNGISKMYACPDLKLGWIMVSAGPGQTWGPDFPTREEVHASLSVRLDTYLNGNDFAQYFFPALAMGGNGLTRSIHQALGESRRQLLSGSLASLEGWRLQPPEGGMHFVLSRKSRRGPDDETLAIRLVKKAGLYTHPGYLYGMDEGCHLVLSLLGGIKPGIWDLLAGALTEAGKP